MKGIFSMILAVLMTVSLAACSSADEKTETTFRGRKGKKQKIRGQTAVY